MNWTWIFKFGKRRIENEQLKEEMRHLKEENEKFRREREELSKEKTLFQEQLQEKLKIMQEEIQKLTKERDDNKAKLNQLHSSLGFSQISSKKENGNKVGRPRIDHIVKSFSFDTDVNRMLETLSAIAKVNFTRCTNDALREYFHQNYTDIYKEVTGNVEALPFESK